MIPKPTLRTCTWCYYSRLVVEDSGEKYYCKYCGGLEKIMSKGELR